MSLEYVWTVQRIKTKTDAQDREDSVHQVDWLVQGWDTDGNEGYYEGSSVLSSDDTEGFTAFDQLTEAKVVSWLKDIISEDEYARIDREILDCIEYSKRPSTVKDALPWQ